MSIFHSIVNHKVNTITAEELLKYAKQFNVSISQQQAKQIADYLRGRNINIFNEIERANAIKEISKLAGAQTAYSIQQIITKFTK